MGWNHTGHIDEKIVIAIKNKIATRQLSKEIMCNQMFLNQNKIKLEKLEKIVYKWKSELPEMWQSNTKKLETKHRLKKEQKHLEVLIDVLSQHYDTSVSNECFLNLEISKQIRKIQK